MVPLALRRGHDPKQEQRGYNQKSGSITEPPGQPDWPVARPLCEAANGQTAKAKCRTDCRTNKRRKREFENVLRTIENSSATRKAIHQPRSAHRFQRIPARDAEPRPNVS